MRIQLLYFTGCPGWELADARLRWAGDSLHLTVEVEKVLVTTSEQAEELSFHGSPSFLMDGRDPFPQPSLPIGLSCRLYSGPEGTSGAPTVDQLVEALAAAALIGRSG